MRKGFKYLRKRKSPLPRLLGLGIPLLFFFLMAGQAVFATTYVITDGPRIYRYTAFRADPARILDEAGLALDERDSYTTQSREDGKSITIRRAGAIQLYYHGKPTRISSDHETVDQLLSRLKLPMDEHDVVSLPPETQLTDGMTLRIDSVQQRRQQYAVSIPGKTRLCNDPTLPEGMRETLIAGHDGELLRTAEVTYVNGVETRQEILREDVTKAPADTLVAVGSGKPIPKLVKGSPPIITENTIRLSTGEVLTYTHTQQIRATAYTHTDEGCDMTTSTGSTVRVGTVAVDPRYIPYGTRMFIIASDGSYIYGIAQAEDCGGAIIGDRMDLYLPTYEDCIEFGRRVCTVYFLG